MKAKEELIKKYKSLAKSDAAQNNPVYAAMIQSVDESVGRIIKKLQTLKLDENTVVIFTSDNGGLSVEEGPNTPATSNTPLQEGKGFLYEGGIRVPLLVYLPSQKNTPLVVDEPVLSVDIFPTILELAGVKSKKPYALDGISLVPVLKGNTSPKHALYWHYPHYSNQGGKPGWAVRQGDYKLIEFFEDGHSELYNIKTDPGEQINLIKELPDKAASLKKKLYAWGKKVGAQMMKPNLAYRAVKNN